MTDDLLFYPTTVEFQDYNENSQKDLPALTYYFALGRYRACIHRSRFDYKVLCSHSDFGYIGTCRGFYIYKATKDLCEAIDLYIELVNLCQVLAKGDINGVF